MSMDALCQAGSAMTAIAQTLGVARSTLYRTLD